jgi:hypothetical protein
LIILILGVGIIVNHQNDSYKEEVSFKEYEKSDKDAYLSFKTHMLNVKGQSQFERQRRLATRLQCTPAHDQQSV